MNKELLVIVYHHGTVNNHLQIGTNYSSGAERSMCNKFGSLLSFILDKIVLSFLIGNFRMRDFDWC